jgi:hypothetical protein
MSAPETLPWRAWSIVMAGAFHYLDPRIVRKGEVVVQLPGLVVQTAQVGDGCSRSGGDAGPGGVGARRQIYEVVLLGEVDTEIRTQIARGDASLEVGDIDGAHIVVARAQIGEVFACRSLSRHTAIGERDGRGKGKRFQVAYEAINAGTEGIADRLVT